MSVKNTKTHSSLITDSSHYTESNQEDKHKIFANKKKDTTNFRVGANLNKGSEN